jgi:hypothetical protein
MHPSHHNNNKSNNYSNVVNCLQDYMLTNEKISDVLKNPALLCCGSGSGFLQKSESKPNSMSIDNSEIKTKKKEKQENKENKENKEEIFVSMPRSIAPPLLAELPSDAQNMVVKKCDNNGGSSSEPVLDLFCPKQKDALFWCYYILKNGFAAYEYQPETTSFASEKESKFAAIEMLRAQKQDLKTHKIKNIKEHVEDELINKERIGMKTFIALCIGSGINVLFIHKRKCFDLVCNMDLDAKTHIVVCQDNLKCPSKYGLEMHLEEDKVSYYREHYFKWESVDKPLKAMGSYKSEELAVLCKKIGLDFSHGQKTKKEMYELLIVNM